MIAGMQHQAKFRHLFFFNESIAMESVSAISLCNKVFNYSAKDSVHPIFHVYRNAVLLLH